MAKYTYVVFSNPAAGCEDEYNRWYDDQHLTDVLKVPGFIAAQRFRLTQDDGKAPARYLALYEMETSDPASTLAELQARAGTAAMHLSDALDVSSVSAALFAALGEKAIARR